MKRLLYLLTTCLIAMSCQPKSEKTAETTAIQEQIVGNDLDEHHCKGSAGYTWSVIKNDCIRTFEVGVRLNPVDSTLNKTLSAFAVFANEDKENEFEVEIFLPSLADSTIILKPIKNEGAGTWSNGSYTLTQWKGMYTLEERKKTIYQGHR